MKRTFILCTTLSTALLATGMLAGAENEGDSAPFESKTEKISYSIGINIGNGLKRQNVEVEYETLLQGIRDTMSGGETLISEEEVRSTLLAFQRELKAKQAEMRQRKGDENLAKGKAFLASNKNREDVQTTSSGLQYKILEEGSGTSPSPNDTVSVHYTGTLLDGTEFDSSHKRGQPAEFRVNGVIKGWTEALQMMKEGGKWKIWVPSDLAYKERGSPGGNIGPNATLAFEIELLEVKPQNPRKSEPVTSDIIKVPSKEELEKGAKIEIIKKEDVEKLKAGENKKKEK